jgi:hypothetical protein
MFGEDFTAEAVADHIASAASTVPEFRGRHHIFTGLVHALAPETWVVQISNLDRRPGEGEFGKPEWRWFRRPPLNEFQVAWRQIKSPAESFGGALGSGALSISRSDFELLGRSAVMRPHRAEDYEGLLAAINARVAKRDKTVSPACQVLYLDPEFREGGPRSEFGGDLYKNGQVVPDDFDRLSVLSVGPWGLDLGTIVRPFVERGERELEESKKRGAGSTEAD